MSYKDPRKTVSRYDSICPKCGKPIKKGQEIYYWPATQKAYHPACGEADYREFLSSVADEEVYNGTGNPY